MEDVKMAEKKLTITKEQAEAFKNWKQEYRADIEFAKVILKQEIGDKRNKSDLFAMLGELSSEIGRIEVGEGSATTYGKEIVSDIQFGVELAKYHNNFTKVLTKHMKEVEPELLGRLFSEPGDKLFEIFNLQM